MADPFLVRTRVWLVITVAGFGLACSERTPAPPPTTTPAATLAPAPPVAPGPAIGEAPASAVSPSPSASPSVGPAPSAAASASASPTADPAEAQRKQQQEQMRAQLAAAKERADSLSAAANTECPDLKPGELRHPGAVAHCARLRGEAAQAVSQYEALKQQAAAAGVNPR
jgi:hypothetical protein